MDGPRPLQMLLVLPYKQRPADHPRVRAWLDRGWEVAEVQRVSDEEALVTLSPPRAGPGSA